MAEGGIAEKFPDDWDIQLLGNTITSQLASGIPPDFLIKRYMFFILFDVTDLILLLKFQFYLIHKILVNLFSGFFFLTSPDKLF